MAMKYNKSLDYVLAAMVKASEGQTVLASKLFAKAITASDFKRGAEILESSNANAEGAPVIAKKKSVVAAAKPRVTARKAVKASEEDDEDEGFDMGPDEDLEILVGEDGDDDDEEDDDVVAGFEDDSADDEEDEEDPVLDSAEFAAVLASMTPQRKSRR